MFKNKALALSTVAVLSLSQAQAQIFGCGDNTNCTGFFYEDINAAFLDCYDSNGVLNNRKEHFFTEVLAKECNSTTFAEFEVQVNGTHTLPNITAATNVSFCDYYEVGTGYQFTQADNDIGLVVIESNVGGERDTYYKNWNGTNDTLHWNWAELQALVEEYATVECQAAGSNSTTGLEAIIDWITRLAEREVIAQCPVPNVDNSTNSTNTTTPTNTTNSTDVDNNGTNSTNNGTNSTDNGTNTTTNGTNSTDNGTNTTTNGTNSTNNGTNGTNGTDNSTIPDNSTDNSTIPNNGTDNSTNSTNNGTDNSTIPNNGTDNSTDNSTNGDNSTLPDGSGGSGSLPGENTTVNSSLGFWNSANYSLPAVCNYLDGLNDTIKCIEGLRSAQFSFEQLNEFWDLEVTEVCTDAQRKFTECESNTVITDQNQCFRQSFYNFFQLTNDQYAYAFFYFDSAARSSLFSECSAVSTFNLTETDFSAGFQFQFNNL